MVHGIDSPLDAMAEDEYDLQPKGFDGRLNIDPLTVEILQGWNDGAFSREFIRFSLQEVSDAPRGSR